VSDYSFTTSGTTLLDGSRMWFWEKYA
jgi:hypothetical protein